MSAPSHVVMVGTSLETRGDVAAVLRAYRDAGLFDRWPVEYVASHRDGRGLVKALKAVDGLLTFLALLCRHPKGVLHVHSAAQASFWRKALFMAMALAARWPVIFHLHGGGFATFYDADCGPLRRRLVRFFLDRAACIVVVSPRWSAWMTRVTRNPHIVSIAPAVTLPEPATNRQPVLIACGLANADAPGGAELMAAVERLRPRFPGLAVEFGKRSWLLARAAMYVLPTHTEGLPLSLLQAMAAGCPVVAGAIGAVPDVVDDGFNGLLVPPRDATALAGAIERLLSQPTLAREMGRAARATIASRFRPEAAVEKLGRLYQQLGVAAQEAGPRATNDNDRAAGIPIAPFPTARRLQESP